MDDLDSGLGSDLDSDLGSLGALADPTRRRVFELLGAGGPQAVTDLARELPVSRPAVSQHLRVLTDVGLVSVRPDGRRRVYRAEPAGLEALRAWVEEQWDAVLDRFEAAARREEPEMALAAKLPPVVKVRVVPLAPVEAFELFTDRMQEWWPTLTHSIAGEEVVGLRFEGAVGGRLVEITTAGEEHAWADVLAWDPPRRFVLSWHPNLRPVAASTLEVRFREVDGGTELTLVHSGWEEFGPDGEGLRENYDGGWDVVLAPLVAAAGDQDG